MTQTELPACVRWNFDDDGSGIRVCKNDHPKTEGCRYDSMHPAEVLAVINELRSALMAREAVEVPPGWKLVPVEPTETMLDAAYEFPASTEDRMRKQWRAMLAASPTKGQL